MHISKAQALLSVLETLIEEEPPEYVRVSYDRYNNLVDEDGNIYDERDLVSFDEKKKGGKKLPPWLMKKGEKGEDDEKDAKEKD